MLGGESSEPVEIGPERIEAVLSLYEHGDYLQAYRTAVEVAPLRRWGGAAGMILAGRLAINLGAPRLATTLHLVAARKHQDDAEAAYYHARALTHRKGPLAGRRYMARRGDLSGAPDEVRADWIAFGAILLGRLRDFAAAESAIAEAERLAPGRPWIGLERSHLLEMEDRREESLAVGRRVLEDAPWYRPAVQSVAHTLQSLGRDDEAFELLSEAARRLECGPLVAQLGLLLHELKRHDEAAKAWDRMAELSPMMEKATARWLAGRRSDTAYELGSTADAARFARESAEPFFLSLAGRLESAPPDAGRVLLDVAFVQQHHQTCAPATLTAIARYWGRPADHLEVAESICYDGTPDHRERSWAESNGWIAREFRVDRDSAVALLERGVPFTLTTVEVVDAHLQAVIGHDARRGTLLIRDPSFRVVGEVFADGLVERYKSTGPRGMVLLPVEEAARLEGLELPESDLYDRLHRLQRSLHVHDRAEAAARLAEMEAVASEHRLTLQAARVLAGYDRDVPRLLAALDRLLALFPDDPLLKLSKLSRLRENSRREDRIALLRGIVAKPESDPVFLRQLARELAVDARERPTVRRLLRRALRLRPTDDEALSMLADAAWNRRAFGEALEDYRLASCLGDKEESHARAYFQAARCLGRTDEALEFLLGRFRRNGSKSSLPARTLFWAYFDLNRMGEAFAVLDEASALRPEDGDLHLFAAERHAALGEFDRAAERLARAEGSTHRAARLRAAAELAAEQGEPPRALELWDAVLELEPDAVDAHFAAVRLTAETAGNEAALVRARDVARRFPHNGPLQKLWIQWIMDEGPDVAEPAARELVAAHPDDVWGRATLAELLARLGRFDESIAELERGEALEPDAPVLHHAKGEVHALAGRDDEAKAAFRQALTLSVDDDAALDRLIDLCGTRAERLAELRFVESELARQVVFGEGLLAFQRLARTTIEPDELLESLRKAWTARPDLWHAWSAYARQLDATGRHDEAARVANEGIERFPLQPRLRYDLAAVEASRGDKAAQVEELKRALRIAPGWSAASRQLAQVYEETGRIAESREVLEQATARASLDPLNHGYLADALWQLGEKEAALDRVRRAVVLDPDYRWAWDSLARWSGELGRPDESAGLARDLTRRRGGDPDVWMILARVLNRPEDLDERLAALDRAIELSPRLSDAHDLRAECLALAGRFDEARAASRPEVYGDDPPVYLLGRAAWVEETAGDRGKAVELMRDALRVDPDYPWGWRRLLEWLDDAPGDEGLEAAENVVRLEPESPVGFGYRGEIRTRLEDRAGAKADFRRAIELSPDYGYAHVRLFDLLLEDGELDEAEAALARHVDALGRDRSAVSRESRLRTARRDRDGALASFRELCRMEGDETFTLGAAHAALVAAGWEMGAHALLRELLESGEASPQVAAFWVESRTSVGDFEVVERIETLRDRPEVFVAALETLLRELGKAQAGADLDRVLKTFDAEVKAEARLWGMAGFALTTVPGRRPRAIRLMADWRTREGVAAWMLSNLVIALRAEGRAAEAEEAGRAAIRLEPDVSTDEHRCWLAVDALIAGRIDEAESLVAPVPDADGGTSLALQTLARLGLEATRAAETGRRGEAVRTLSRLHGRLRECGIAADDLDAVRRTFVRLARATARRAGGIVARLRVELLAARPTRSG